MKISILIEISILIKISILMKSSNVVCFLHLPHPHPVLNFGILSLEYQKEIWQIDEEINIVQKGKVRCIKKLSCGLIIRRETWRMYIWAGIPVTDAPMLLKR